ncbi:C-X-C chemokine receptor type 3 [Dissostichus eleginoides]|uniref:C-X-C chemokine receptor type 3 n=1 Tax=Dissostichus eleginoides TaxID=100907 RepID=A0AAD9C4Q8_DISEL|nr:C-X-C chemokine receptor type 3 [Dissostichus eleginoides]
MGDSYTESGYSLIDGMEDLYEMNNSSDEYCCYDGDVCDLNEGMHFESVFIPVLYSVAFAVGVLGNGVLLGVLARSRGRWSVTDTFILHLGVADILLLLTLPLWAAQSAQEEGWTFGTPLCKITGAVFTINFYCGIFLLACISLDRYLSIVHATQMYSRRNPRVVHISCLAVWIFSLLLSLPDWVFYEAVQDDRRGNSTECVPNYFRFDPEGVFNWELASRLLSHTAGFLLPSAVLIFCYSCILHRLRCGSQGLQKQKAFRIIVAVVVVFFICWTPYHITLMVDTLHSGNSCGVRVSLQKAMVVTSSLGYLHCSLNPILYAFVGVKFRRQLVDILRYMGCQLKMSAKLQSVTSRRSSVWSESADTSNSIAV